MWRMTCCALALIGLSGCGTMFTDQTSGKSTGEVESGYTYVPIDPFPVNMKGNSCQATSYVPLLDALPDNAVRMLVEQFGSSGSVTYGASKAAIRGNQYRVTVDYINADTINFRVWIAKSMVDMTTNSYEPVFLLQPPGAQFKPGSEIYEVTRTKPDTRKGAFPDYSEFNIPVYVGVGLRVSANVTVVAANANISGIGIIGAEAEAENLRGSLVVQTLGVNGKSVAAALPIQSELNRTTAQNAIVAVGSIKALLYADETIKSPRVVGIYLPFPGGKPLVNAIISELSKSPVEWERPCSVTPVPSKPKGS